MAAPSKKIQVVVDENVFSILTRMGAEGLRGKTRSEVAYKILDEWIWHNHSQIKDWGIPLRPNKAKRRT